MVESLSLGLLHPENPGFSEISLFCRDFEISFKFDENRKEGDYPFSICEV
jgi:hypothetical protein